jgi:pimeloyl-ACP methyl ester carboxylesterase
MTYERREIEIAGSRLVYHEAGRGRPLLFLHGAAGSGALLPALAPLAACRRVIIPDHPGFGASAEPAWLDDIHDVAYAYLDLLEALDLRGVHLAGTSLGGWIALEIAIRDATRLAALTVIGASGIRPGDIPTGDLFLWSPEDRIRNLVADPALAERLLAVPPSPEQQEVAVRNFFTTAKLAWEPRFFDPTLEKWLHRIRIPVHVVWGAEDRLFPLAYGQRLHALIPGARFTVLDRCGHLPHAEQPERLRALLEAA